MPKYSKPADLRTILSGVLGTLERTDKAELLVLAPLWCQAVGERIAAQAQPGYVRSGVLWVRVSNSVWMQELHFLKNMLLERLNACLRASRLADIRFYVGGQPHAGPSGHRCPPARLTADEDEKIKKDSMSIQDPEVRQAFQGLMAAYLLHRKTNRAF